VVFFCEGVKIEKKGEFNMTINKKDVRLFSYKMTHDSGFAPNPFGGVLTLATCKADIRKCKRVDDWLVGFTSEKLNGDKVGDEKLIYLMQIEEKICFEDYWKNSKYKNKKPNINSQDAIKKTGDNIYMPIVEIPKAYLDYKQLPNYNHNENNKENDLMGKYVLVSSNFYYFGANPVVIPNNIKPKVPVGRARYGWETHDMKVVKDFLSYIESKYEKGIYSHPHTWFKNDKSWKNDENYIKS